MDALLFAALGALVGLGATLLVAAALGREVVPRLGDHLPDGARRELVLVMGVVAVLVGGVVYAITGWPVAAVGVVLLVLIVPSLFRGRRHQEVFIARTQAIAAWTEMIRDNLAGAAGLEQALLATAPLAPAPIKQEVLRLEARLDRQVPLIEALRLLGDELDHPSADLVVVAIAKASRMEVRELNPLLTRLSTSIREDVRMRLRVEVSRARIRQSSRIVIGFTVVFMVLLYVFSGDLLRPYDTVGGQVWLGVVAVIFGAAGWMIAVYGRLETPPRFTIRRSAVLEGQQG